MSAQPIPDPLDALETQRADLVYKLARLDEAIAALRAMREPGSVATPPVTGRFIGYKKEKAMEEVLREHGGEMEISALIDELRRNGCFIAGNEKRYLASTKIAISMNKARFSVKERGGKEIVVLKRERLA